MTQNAKMRWSILCTSKWRRKNKRARAEIQVMHAEGVRDRREPGEGMINEIALGYNRRAAGYSAQPK